MFNKIKNNRKVATVKKKEQEMSGVKSVFLPALLLVGSALQIHAENVWRSWPRDDQHIKVVSQNGAVEFSIQDFHGEASCYTYFPVSGSSRKLLRFQYRNTRITQGKRFRQQLKLMFTAGDAQYGSRGIVTLDLPVRTKDTEFRYEFMPPEGADKFRLLLPVWNDGNGTFHISNLSLRDLPDTASIPYLSNAPSLNGKIDNSWQKTGRLGNFCVIGSDEASRLDTSLQMAYDGEFLYAAFRCSEPEMNRIKRNMTQFDSQVWSDDSVELMVAAPNQEARQYILNVNGTRWDGRLSVRVPGDPWRAEESWNGKWKGAASAGKDGYTAVFAIPFSDFGAGPSGKWRINAVRHARASIRESSHLNCFEGPFNNVEKFATLELDAPRTAMLRRYTEPISAAPLKIVRRPLQAEKLAYRDALSPRIMGMAGTVTKQLYSSSFQRKHASDWTKIRDQAFKEIAASGMEAPAVFPWVSARFGSRQAAEKYAERSKTGFLLAMHNTSHSAAALSRGAKFSKPSLKNSVNAIDPVLRNVITDWLNGYLAKEPWVKPLTIMVRGFDEPSNNLEEIFSFAKNPQNRENLNDLDALIRREYGAGRYGIYDAFADNRDPEAPFRRIAFLRYWNDRLDEANAFYRNEVKRHFPQIPFTPVVVNTVANYRGIVDFARLAKHADWIGVDPYPTSTLAVLGRARALYHTGFSVKMARDLSGGKPVYSFIQAFRYHGRAPKGTELDEWVAQALKNGAEILNYYSDANLETCPEVFHAALETARKAKSTRLLRLPVTPALGVLYSDFDFWGRADDAAHRYYALYAILGESLGIPFEYISASSAASGQKNLKSCQLLIVPGLRFAEPGIAEKLIRYVKDGGALVIFDPEALSFAPDGSETPEIRHNLFGLNAPLRPVAASCLKPGPASGISPDCKLPLAAVKNMRDGGRVHAFSVQMPKDAELLALYSDGACAGFKRNFGKGVVYFFAAQPFGNSDFAVMKTGWNVFFTALAQKWKCPQKQEYWNYQLPGNKEQK